MTQTGNRRGMTANSNGTVTQTQTIDRPGIPLSEVEKHMSVNDAWTVIDNEVYDITEWIPLHPGGDLVRLAAGREATCLFESYHPGSSMQRVKAAIQNKCKHLGRLADAPVLPNKSFFHDVQARVEKFLNDKKVPRHYFESISALDVALTLFFYAVAVYYKTFLNSTWGAVFAGIWTARGGFLMHMGNHGATSKYQWMNWVTGTMMDLIGSTSLGWKFEHQVAHHMDPNEFRRDNDCEIGDPMLRFHPALKRHWWQRNQHITTLLAMSGGALKWTISDYPNFFAQKISNISFRITVADIVHFLFFKAQWALLHIVIPIYLYGWKGWIGNFILFMVVAGHYLENIFIVNHIQEGLVPPHDPHWANRQVIASANWSSGSPFWNWFSGGLNHQVEHHLFPAISHYNYPAISPIVKQCCKEYNLPYNSFSNFYEAWTAMLRYLRDLGTPKFDAFVEQK